MQLPGEIDAEGVVLLLEGTVFSAQIVIRGIAEGKGRVAETGNAPGIEALVVRAHLQAVEQRELRIGPFVGEAQALPVTDVVCHEVVIGRRLPRQRRYLCLAIGQLIDDAQTVPAGKLRVGFGEQGVSFPIQRISQAPLRTRDVLAAAVRLELMSLAPGIDQQGLEAPGPVGDTGRAHGFVRA